MGKSWTEIRDYGKQCTDGKTPMLRTLLRIVWLMGFLVLAAGILIGAILLCTS